MSNHSINLALHLADNTLILAQRNGEWCAHGPILEQDIAITNITLDLIGQSRNFYQYAASLINENGRNADVATEDTLAYLRKEREFMNCLLVELPNGDWAQTVLRQFLFSVYQSLLFQELQKGKDEQMSAIAAKSLKEVAYHIKWSSEWVIRLGDGTAESEERMKTALNNLWPYTGELFIQEPYESTLGIQPDKFKQTWLEVVKVVLDEASLEIPSFAFMQSGGKHGIHTEHLGFLLAELQYLQRTYPGAEW